jgi:ubiquinone/menaquinone biosynthesis C-methylase UbiE
LEKDERGVAEWYNALSSSYDELYGKEQAPKIQAVLELLENRRFQVLIDIGCGTGIFLKQAQRIYDYGIGIDLSTKMLQIAKERGTLNTDLVLASSSSLPIKNASIDCAISISTTKSDANLSSLIIDLERTARKDSVLAITVFRETGTPNPVSLTTNVESKTISPRETLYFLRQADTLK